MYKIQRKPFGYEIILDGFIKEEEMQNWYEEAKDVLKTKPHKFGVFVDLRNLLPLPRYSQVYLEEGQKLFKKSGMERSAVILKSATLTLQFKHLAKDSGIYVWERYVDASKNDNWEEVAKDWIINGIDPDE